jgi:bacterioferritin
MRSQADESLVRSHETGELSTHLDHLPSLEIGSLLETHKHDIGAI